MQEELNLPKPDPEKSLRYVAACRITKFGKLRIISYDCNATGSATRTTTSSSDQIWRRVLYDAAALIACAGMRI